jgi:hypothetical protein
MMSILKVVEYKEEGVAIIEDDQGTFIVTDAGPEIYPLGTAEAERDSFFLRRGLEPQQSWHRMLT